MRDCWIEPRGVVTCAVDDWWGRFSGVCFAMVLALGIIGPKPGGLIKSALELFFPFPLALEVGLALFSGFSCLELEDLSLWFAAYGSQFGPRSGPP